jgi:hypothetical protein
MTLPKAQTCHKDATTKYEILPRYDILNNVQAEFMLSNYFTNLVLLTVWRWTKTFV